MGFSNNEWNKITELLSSNPERYGFPEGGREKSLVLSSFNIRKLGKLKGRERELEFMASFCAACDLVAIQEVQDDISGLRFLKDCTETRIAGRGEFALAISDTTGKVPGESGMAERLAFLYRHRRIKRLELATDLTFDRTAVLNRLFDDDHEVFQSYNAYAQKLAEFRSGTSKRKPKFVPPTFLTFLRTPYVVAFEAPAANNSESLKFTAVNAHLVYGTMREREQEFNALVNWLASRLNSSEYLLTPNFILMGDLNLNFDKPMVDRKRIDRNIRNLNQKVFGSSATRRIYFPFLDKHPRFEKVLRTNARASQTFDHFGFFNGAYEKNLPNDQWRNRIPSTKRNWNPDAFEYGVFDFAQLFSQALKKKSYLRLSRSEKSRLGKKFEHSVSDHLPIWVRLPRPGF